MAANFEQLESEAIRRRDAESARPWLRVGTALCGQAAGADAVVAAVSDALESQGVDARLTEVGCIGLCYAEPLLDVQLPGGPRVFYGNFDPDRAGEVVSTHVAGGQPVEELVLGYLAPEGGGDDFVAPPGLRDLALHPMRAWENRIALRNAGNIDPLDIYQYIATGGYRALSRALLEMTPEDALQQVNESGLRGRGGAAFPTATKWRFLAGNPSRDKYVLCNCEEGDPGAFNDKAILESDPHTLVEGVIIAGYATGASRGYIFIRHGHDGPIDRCRAAVKQAQELGLLGENILGSDFSFDIEVALTGDSYVAGEESALMEAIEGKRAMPRFRPPFPAQYGLFGKPTNINNVKTLAYVPEIVSKGGEWFASIGHERSTGTAILCLSGPLNYTGMMEVPLGINLKDVLYDAAGGIRNGKGLKFLQTGGPLGGGTRRGQCGHRARLRGSAQRRGHLGVRWHHCGRRRHVCSRPDPRAGGVLPVRVMRQVLPLQDGHEPPAGSAGKDLQPRRGAGGPRPDAPHGREHAGRFPLRPWSAGIQSRFIRPEIFSR